MAEILALIILLLCGNVLSQHAERQLQTWSSNCSYWSHFNRDTNTCDCDSELFGIVSCEKMEGTNTEVNVSVNRGYCMTLTNNMDEAVVGACPYHPLHCMSKTKTLSCFYVPASRNLSTDFCQYYNRTGQLCGQCMHDYAPPVYSYYSKCVRCIRGINNWPKYLAVSLLPTTAFLLALTIIRFRAMSPQLTGYIILCQILTSPILLRIFEHSYKQNRDDLGPAGDLYFSLLSLWNLDFFRWFYKPFCLHPNATTLQVLSLDYIIAVYPLFLIILTYTLVRLHYNNYRLVVWLWRPFIGCFARCRRQWDIQNSLVDAFATFLLLSYVKFLSVSFDLLTPTVLWDSKASIAGIALYYDGSTEYFGKHHLPYATMAISVLLVFTFLPILLLCLYPCRCFQRLLNRCHCNSPALHYFMDSFQGCFKDGTNGTKDCRYFSALYLIIRIAMFLGFVITNNTFSTFYQTVTLLGMIVLLTCFQPYRNTLYTKLDVFFLATLGIVVNSAWKLHGKTSHSLSSKVDNQYMLLAPIPIIYPLCLILHYIWRRSARLRAVLMGKYKICCCKKSTTIISELDDTSPLLNF